MAFAVTARSVFSGNSSTTLGAIAAGLHGLHTEVQAVGLDGLRSWLSGVSPRLAAVAEQLYDAGYCAVGCCSG